ncbi:MAG: hypothetical protein ACOYCD_06880 [Kiritimatiellia bacterium]
MSTGIPSPPFWTKNSSITADFGWASNNDSSASASVFYGIADQVPEHFPGHVQIRKHAWYAAERDCQALSDVDFDFWIEIIQ